MAVLAFQSAVSGLFIPAVLAFPRGRLGIPVDSSGARDFVMGHLHWFLALLYGGCAMPVELVWIFWRSGETFGDFVRSLVLSIAVSIIGHVLDVSG